MDSGQSSRKRTTLSSSRSRATYDANIQDLQSEFKRLRHERYLDLVKEDIKPKHIPALESAIEDARAAYGESLLETDFEYNDYTLRPVFWKGIFSWMPTKSTDTAWHASVSPRIDGRRKGFHLTSPYYWRPIAKNATDDALKLRIKAAIVKKIACDMTSTAIKKTGFPSREAYVRHLMDAYSLEDLLSFREHAGHKWHVSFDSNGSPVEDGYSKNVMSLVSNGKITDDEHINGLRRAFLEHVRRT